MNRATESFVSSTKLVVRVDKKSVRTFFIISFICLLAAIFFYWFSGLLGKNDAEFVLYFLAFPLLVLAGGTCLFTLYLCIRINKAEDFIIADGDGLYIGNIVQRPVPWTEIQEVRYLNDRMYEWIFLKFKDARLFMSDRSRKSQRLGIRLLPYPKESQEFFESCDAIIAVPECAVSTREVYEFIEAKVASVRS